MRKKLIAAALIASATALTATAHAAVVDDVIAGKYCLSEYCLGDPAKNYESLGGTGFSREANPNCTGSVSRIPLRTRKAEARIGMAFEPFPALVGKPNNEYYRVASVIIEFDRPLDEGSLTEELKSLAKRMPSMKRGSGIYNTYDAKDSAGGQVTLTGHPGLISLTYRQPKSAFKNQPGCRAGRPGL